MDPLQARAIDALQPFVALSKSASSARAASELITRATSAPHTYVFAELLETPNIQSLRHAGGEFTSSLTLLEIFAWGTCQDYAATPGLPSLNEAQIQKLRLLSLLPLCSTSEPLTYTYLQTALSLPTPRALEDLVISATYAGLLTAKLSPSTQVIHVSASSPLRDLRPGSVPTMVAALDEWDGRCTSILADLESQIKQIRVRAADRRRRKVELAAAVDRAVQSTGGGATDKGVGKRAAADREGGGLGEQVSLGGEYMDVDGGGDATGGRNGPGGSASGSQRKNARTRILGVGGGGGGSGGRR
ncbi:MAG: hypothetical protein M1838_005477 [Thelocarpon superellum]|nr:MAG: hypothetical protein M1838_005477 [Thelocarpon superellum]